MAQDNSTDEVEVRKEYYESGALHKVSPFVNGKMHGIEKFYFESGALWEETPYVKGRRHGIVKVYNKDKANIEYLVLYKEDREVYSTKS